MPRRQIRLSLCKVINGTVLHYASSIVSDNTIPRQAPMVDTVVLD